MPSRGTLLKLDPRRVPTIPVEVDWSHPLAQKLLYICAPGSPHGFQDIGSNGPLLVPSSLIKWGQTQYGPGIDSTSGSGSNTSTGASSASGQIGKLGIASIGATGTTSSVNTGGITIFWAGRCLGPPAANVYGYPFVSWVQTPNNASGFASSYNYAMRFRNVSGDASVGFVAVSGVAGSKEAVFTGVLTGGRRSIAGTFWSAGSVPAARVVADGTVASAVQTSGFDSSTPRLTYTSTATVSSLGYIDSDATSGNAQFITAVTAVYNDNLNLSQIEWLDAEPFAMLRPRSRRSYSIFSAIAPGTVIKPPNHGGGHGHPHHGPPDVEHPRTWLAFQSQINASALVPSPAPPRPFVRSNVFYDTLFPQPLDETYTWQRFQLQQLAAAEGPTASARNQILIWINQ